MGDLSVLSHLCPGEGNVLKNPLQYSCLENPMDRGAWCATAHGVAKSQIWLSMHARPIYVFIQSLAYISICSKIFIFIFWIKKKKFGPCCTSWGSQFPSQELSPGYNSESSKSNTRPPVKVLVIQLCLTLCDPMECSTPGFSLHGILQASILEWVAIPFSRGSSWPRDQTQVSCVAGRFFTVLAIREAQTTRELFNFYTLDFNPILLLSC